MDKTYRRKSEKLNIRFCKEQEVNDKRQIDIMEKSTFLAKMKILKRVGQNNEILAKTERWLEVQNGKKFNQETKQRNNALLDKAQAILLEKLARKRLNSVSEIKE